MVEISDKTYKGFIKQLSVSYSSIAGALKILDEADRSKFAEDLYFSFTKKPPFVSGSVHTFEQLYKRGLVTEKMRRHLQNYILRDLTESTTDYPDVRDYIEKWEKFGFDPKRLRKAIIKLVGNMASLSAYNALDLCKEARISSDELNEDTKTIMLHEALDSFSKSVTLYYYELKKPKKILEFLGKGTKFIGEQYLKAGDKYLRVGKYKNAKKAYSDANAKGAEIGKLRKEIQKKKRNFKIRRLARLLDGVKFDRNWRADFFHEDTLWKSSSDSS